MYATSPPVDLQAHSTYSDGALSPSELVAAAANAGVKLLALTDHDSVEGVPEATDAARGLDIELLPGVEISTNDPLSGDLHILGYRITLEHEPLREQLQRSRQERTGRSGAMARALRDNGFEVDDDAARRLAGAAGAVGRPHLAAAVVADPRNRRRLEHEQLADAPAFLEAYLIEGRPAFVPRSAPSVATAIELIHGAGGLAVWAHPFWDVSEPDAVLTAIDRFADAGLDGVEAFYVTHTAEQTLVLADVCDRRGLLSTASSDFHGPHHRLFSRFLAYETYGATPNLTALWE